MSEPRKEIIGDAELWLGDCIEVMRDLPADSFDSIVTDPPYELGFMGKFWDRSGIAFRPETWAAVLRVLKPGGYMVAFGAPRKYHRMACAIEDAGFEVRDCLMWIFGQGFPKSKALLKPAYEPIILARKPGPLQHLNIDGCRVGTEGGTKAFNHAKKPDGRLERWDEGSRGARNEIAQLDAGRWPANVIHDGSDEVLAGFPETKSGLLRTHHVLRESPNVAMSGKNYARSPRQDSFGDSGSAARFFYCAKAGKADRAGSKHPTVKPLALMRWLCRLVTPPGGLVLDPFAGSGTTLQAARDEGFRAIGIEQVAEYQADIVRRLLTSPKPAEQLSLEVQA